MIRGVTAVCAGSIMTVLTFWLNLNSEEQSLLVANNLPDPRLQLIATATAAVAGAMALLALLYVSCR